MNDLIFTVFLIVFAVMASSLVLGTFVGVLHILEGI